jgi:hypothetical protein
MLVPLLLVRAAAAEDRGEENSWRRAPEGTFKLVRFTFTRKLKERRPVDSVKRVPCDGEPVYAHAELFNKGPDRRVVMTWKRDGRQIARYQLSVRRSPSWKTWSFKRATGFNKGKWVVLVEDEEGHRLSRERLSICGG